MRFKTITRRIMVTVLPIVVLATTLLTSISYIVSSRIISTETTMKMMAVLDTELEKIHRELGNNAAVAQALVCYVESAATDDFESGKYKKFMFNIIPTNPTTMGGGIWYEPYKLKSDVQYFGPYVHMENGSPVFTNIYSNADYDYPNTDWYINGKNSSGGIAWSDVYYDHVSGATMLTGTLPFYDENKQFLGTTTADMDGTEIQRIVRAVEVGDTGKAILIGANGAYISYWDNDKTPEMLISSDSDPDLAVLGKIIQSHESGTASFMRNNVEHKVFYKTMPMTRWRLAIVMEESEISSVVREMTVTMLIVTLVTMTIMAFVIISLTKYLRNKLGKITAFSELVAGGDLANHIEMDTKDEFSLIAEHLNLMLDHLSRMNRDRDKMIAKSLKLVSEIEKSTAEIFNGSKQIEEKTDQNVKIAREAANMMDIIRCSAEKGSVQMNHMMQAVREMNEASGQIEKIIKVIDDIAFQTNILALNASVEAARAGEHGKSFSVVAEEVRNLASKSAEAAKKTAGLVENTVEKANIGLNIATQTSAVLEEIVVGINLSAENAARIAQLSDEQAVAINQVNIGINQVVQVIQNNKVIPGIGG